MRSSIAWAFVAAAIASASATAGVPTTVGFSARLVSEDTGEAVDGTHRVKFELFDAATGGASVWFEGRDIEVEDGLLFLDLGATKALDPAIFSGSKLWLEVTLDEVVMEPRMALDSVPYAIRATAADTVGGMTPDDLQQRVTGTCSAGNFIIGVNPDGTVACAPDLSGSGDITDVLPGAGLQGGGTAGAVTLSLLQTCAANQVLKWNGTAWGCAADAGGNGDITSVLVGPAGGLAGGNTTGDVTLSLLTTCGVNQVLKWNGATWVCAADVDTDTNSGGDIFSVITGPNSGLVGGATAGDPSLSLLTTCAAGQLLKWNGTAWFCASDIDTDTNAGGTVQNVVAGNGLTGGGGTATVTLDVGAGAGITVAANAVSLDTAFTNSLYVNAAGDTMTGTLTMGAAIEMQNNRLNNRGCPPAIGGTGYIKARPGLCVLAVSDNLGGLNFTQCANTCAANGAHMCSSVEMRAAMASGVGLGIFAGDWIGDQIGDDEALTVNNNSDANNPDGLRTTATTTSTFCRCCGNVE